MMTRSLLAFIAGFVIYLVAMMMTTYDGVLSLVFQPLLAILVTSLSCACCLALGSPLLFDPVWRTWRKVPAASWILLAISCAIMLLSWHPSLRIHVHDPGTGGIAESFNPTLSVLGWFGTLFSILWNPAIGITQSKKWA
jgi:hypothetical protein